MNDKNNINIMTYYPQILLDNNTNDNFVQKNYTNETTGSTNFDKNLTMNDNNLLPNLFSILSSNGGNLNNTILTSLLSVLAPKDSKNNANIMQMLLSFLSKSNTNTSSSTGTNSKNNLEKSNNLEDKKKEIEKFKVVKEI